MEFDEIVVKESPGLCRCCLSEGCYKDLGTEYVWMEEAEIYADMLLECFDISISQHIEGPNGPNRFICEVCITRLRDACNFKKQVLESEKKFIDMLGRGEFKSKVIAYQDQMKAEVQSGMDTEVEFLEDDIDYDDRPGNDMTEPSISEDITVETLPIKSKKGRPRKNAVKPEKKKTKTEDKPKSKIVRGIRTKKYQESCLERLTILRRNIIMLLYYGNVVPFLWNTRCFRCFYCHKQIKDCDSLKEHTIVTHKSVDLQSFVSQTIITKDVPIKIDIKNLSCKLCNVPLLSIEDLKTHIKAVHEEEYDNSVGVCVFPFILTKNILECTLCDDKFNNYTSLMGHMYKKHIAHPYMCQMCGLSFIDQIRLKRHFSNSHIGYRCKLCGKILDALHKLEKHKARIHGIQRIVKCSLCSSTFDNQYQIKVHMGKIHNVEKYRIKCDYCSKICTTKGAMLLHIQSLHSDVRFECDICDYKTGIKWMVKLHKRKHFGEKNYVCSMCEKHFGRSSNLRAHMKVHTGNFGRVCRSCRHGFVDAESLEKHEKETHYYSQYN